MRTRIVFLGLLLALVAPLGAQTGKPFVKFPQTKESLARAIEYGQDGDMKVLNITATDFVKEMNEIYNLKLENREDLANHLRSLTEMRLPQGISIHFGRLIGSKPDDKGWERPAHENEYGLLNKVTQRIELSLWCGNPTPGLLFEPKVPERLVMTQVESPEPAPVSSAPTTTNAQVGITTPTKVEVVVSGEVKLTPNTSRRETHRRVERSHWSRNWGWYVGSLITGVVGYYAIDNNPQWFRRSRDVIDIDIKLHR